jgi:hypothetical protein
VTTAAALTRRLQVQLSSWLYGHDPQEFGAQAALLTVEQHCADDREQRPIRRSFSPGLPELGCSS